MAERINAYIGKENTEDKEKNNDVLITAEEPICKLYSSTIIAYYCGVLANCFATTRSLCLVLVMKPPISYFYFRSMLPDWGRRYLSHRVLSLSIYPTIRDKYSRDHCKVNMRSYSPI